MDTPTAVTIILIFRFNVSIDFNMLIAQLMALKKPLVPEDLNINVSEEVTVSDNVSVAVSSGLRAVGSLSMVKTTNNPRPEELALIQAARRNRPNNSFTDVKVSYNEQGTITAISWKET